MMNGNLQNPLNLKSLNHISLVCRSVDDSIAFHQNLLGFVPIRRPGSFNFDGAWLFGYGIGIHLLQSEDPESMEKKTDINPKDNHLSFQCESMETVEKKLREMEIKHLFRKVVKEGMVVDQFFFHGPDGFMIRICNCDSLPVRRDRELADCARSLTCRCYRPRSIRRLTCRCYRPRLIRSSNRKA